MAQALQRCAGDMGEGLLGGHQGQIPLGLKGKEAHHLGHHLPVLPGQHHPGVKAIGLLESADHRRHLDGFRAGAQHQGDACGLGQQALAIPRTLRTPNRFALAKLQESAPAG